MKFYLPEFHFRFISNAGHTILPLNFHPHGCQQFAASMIDRLIELQPSLPSKSAGNWLIIGGSGGFGCAARAVLTTCFSANTLSISLDAQPQPESSNQARQLGSPGFHRNLAMTRRLRQLGRTSISVNADVFSPDTRRLAIDTIRHSFRGSLDGIVWALATSRGFNPRLQQFVPTALKPYPTATSIKTFRRDTSTEPIHIVEPLIPAGTPEEVVQTQYVMGGQLVECWIQDLLQAEVLAQGFSLLTLSYRGSELTEAIYRKGIIGLAKADLEFQTKALNQHLQTQLDGRAVVVEAPAVVTEASGGIPGVPLYLALLMKVMGQRYEDPLAVMLRLFTERCSPMNRNIFLCDQEGFVRLDDRELDPEIRQKMNSYFHQYHEGDEVEVEIYNNFMNQYQQIRGFSLPGIDYSKEIDTREFV